MKSIWDIKVSGDFLVYAERVNDGDLWNFKNGYEHYDVGDYAE